MNAFDSMWCKGYAEGYLETKLEDLIAQGGCITANKVFPDLTESIAEEFMGMKGMGMSCLWNKA